MAHNTPMSSVLQTITSSDTTIYSLNNNNRQISLNLNDIQTKIIKFRQRQKGLNSKHEKISTKEKLQCDRNDYFLMAITKRDDNDNNYKDKGCLILILRPNNKFAVIETDKIKFEFENVSNVDRILAFSIIQKLLLIYGINGNNKHVLMAFTINENSNNNNKIEMNRLYQNCEIDHKLSQHFNLKAYCNIEKEWILLFQHKHGLKSGAMIVRFRIIMDNNIIKELTHSVSSLKHHQFMLKHQDEKINKVTTDGHNLLFILLSRFSLYCHNIAQKKTFLMAHPTPNALFGTLMTKRIFMFPLKLFSIHSAELLISGFVRNVVMKHKLNIPVQLNKIILSQYGMDISLFIGYNDKRNENMKIAFAGIVRCPSHEANETFIDSIYLKY